MKKPNCLVPLLFTVAWSVSAAGGEMATRYESAVAQARVITLDDSLGEIETLWLPARYLRDSEASALYLRGVRYVAPDGQGHVAGFTRMDDGNLLVATLQDRAPLEDLQMPLRRGTKFSVFYKVSPAGETLVRLGVLEHLGRVVTARTGIFVEQRTDPMSGHSLFGYSTGGQPVAGPQNVQFAAPTEDGGWWIVRRKDEDRALSLMSYSYLAPDGRESYLRDGRWLRRHEYLRTESAMVNLPTWADSARTGFSMLLTLFGEGDFAAWHGAAHAPGRENPGGLQRRGLGGTPVPVRKLGHYEVEYGGTRRMDAAVARDLARRNGLFRAAGRVLLVGQLDAAETRGAHVGIVDLLAQEGEVQHGTPLFRLEGTGMKLLRTFLGNNTGRATASSRNDAYVFVKPGGALVVLAHGEAVLDGKALAYDIALEAVVDAGETLAFLRAHQVSD